VFARETLGHRPGAVGRVVVDQDHVQRWMALREERTQRVRQLVRLVARGDDSHHEIGNRHLRGRGVEPRLDPPPPSGHRPAHPERRQRTDHPRHRSAL